VRLARSRLPVGQEGGVVALEDRLNQVAASLVYVLLLTGVHDVVEPEYLLLVVLAFYIDRGTVSLG
jgi:hypothetical protein